MCFCCPFSCRNHGEAFFAKIQLWISFIIHMERIRSHLHGLRKERENGRERERETEKKNQTNNRRFCFYDLLFLCSEQAAARTNEKPLKAKTHTLTFALFLFLIRFRPRGRVCVCVLFIVAKFCAIGYNFQWESVLCILCARNSTWYINMVLVAFFPSVLLLLLVCFAGFLLLTKMQHRKTTTKKAKIQDKWKCEPASQRE